MNYQPKNSGLNGGRNGRGSRYKKPIKIVATIVVVLIFVRLVVPGAFDSFFAFVFSPLWRMENAASADDFFATHAALVAENTRLTDELAALAPVQSSVALLEQENADLKALLGRTPSQSNDSDQFVLAAVLKMPPLSAYDSLIIDIGSNKNIQNGDRVFALASPSIAIVASSSTASSSTQSVASSSSATTTEVLIPIGTVSEISGGSSKVELFSSPGMKYSVEIGPKHIPAEAVAQGGGMFSAQLAQGTDINVGDPVTIPDIETLPFGTVGAIVNDPAQPYMVVLFNEPVNIYELRWVLVGNNQTVDK